MKKLKWSYARILLYSILLLFMASLLSCEKDEQCDCVKVTYEYDWTICFDEVNNFGLPYRCENNHLISEEENYCGEAVEGVIIDGNIMYDVICN
jgi:hypothetical protein